VLIYLRRRAWLGCTGYELQLSDGMTAVYICAVTLMYYTACTRDVYLILLL
jgi:hypothetical protein